ncbi:kinase-like protein, partial [Pleurotus eryngii]
ALFQNEPTGVISGENQDNLIAELRLLTSAQYFTNSFKECAKLFGYTLPGGGFKWNVDGAFVAQVTSALPERPTNGAPDTRSLLFEHVLIAPFIERSALHQERKFSGSEQAGNNKDEVGKMMDAFAHHVFVDSQGSLIFTDIQGIISPDGSVVLFDPQAHSSDESTGYWDKGVAGLKAWLRDHKCSNICKKLQLHRAPTDVHIPAPPDEKPCLPLSPTQNNHQPLRYGFPSP